MKSLAPVLFLLLASAHLPGQKETPDGPRAIPKWMLENGGKEEFMDLLVTGKRVGTAKDLVDLDAKREGQKVYLWRFEMRMKMVALGEEVETTVLEEQWFDPEPPHAFLGGRSEELTDDEGRKVRVVPSPDKQGAFVAHIEEAGRRRTLDWSPRAYHFTDVTAPYAWIESRPDPGDQLSVASLTVSTVEDSVETYELVSKPDPEKKTRLYEVALSDSREGRIGRAFCDDRGLYESLKLGAFMELRKVAKEEADRKIEAAGDMFVEAIIRTDKKLGDVGQLREVVLEIASENARGIRTGPNQKAVFDEERKVLTLKIGRQHGELQEVVDKARKRAMEESALYPIRDGQILRLSKRALRKAGNPEDDEAKIAALVGFVDRWLRDSSEDYSTIGEILENRTGDCTEHAMLFVTLARSQGIPAREVSGFLYLEELGGFGGHAWAEVAIDGKWRPVDPAWGEVWPSAGHIRAHADGASDLEDIGALAGNDFKAKILKVKRAEGE